MSNISYKIKMIAMANLIMDKNMKGFKYVAKFFDIPISYAMPHDFIKTITWSKSRDAIQTKHSWFYS